MIKKVGESSFKKYIRIAVPLILLISIGFGVAVSRLRFDYDFEKFYPAADEDTRYFMEFRQKFQSENDFLIAAIPLKGSVFEEKKLKKLDALTKKIEGIDLVNAVMSLTNQSEHFILPDGTVASKAYIDFSDIQPKRDSIRVYAKRELLNSLVAKDGGALGLYIKHKDYISKKESDRLISELDKIFQEEGFEGVKLAGRTIGQKYYIDEMLYEVLLFVGLSGLLVMFFLFIAFRSLWGVLVPLIVIFISLIWILGSMSVFNTPMNIILVVLPSIMFIVAMSDAIHLVSRYLDALRAKHSTWESIQISIKEVGLSTFLTSLTTAIGFFSLTFVRVEPIKVFGLVMGIGVLIAFLITIAALPILFYYFPGPKHIRKKSSNHFWYPYLSKWFRLIIRRPWQIVLVWAGVTLFASIGIQFVVTNNYLMDDINPKEALKQDFDYMDNNFGGVRPYSLVITLKDSSKQFWDREVLVKLDSIESFLTRKHNVQIRSSLVTTLKVINRGAHSGIESYYTLPTSQKKIRSYRKNLRIAAQGKLLRSMLDSTEHIMLISGTMPDLGNVEVTKRNKLLEAFMKQDAYAREFNYRVTGSAYLIDKNLSYLASSMVQGLSLSVGIIALIMGLVFRSLQITWLSLIPNLIPLIVIAGVMGYGGIELKTSTAIIFTIAFGIAVDDTIHFLGKFKVELRKGKGKLYAMKRTYLTTGKAMILTTLILCGGFLLLLLSNFMGTFYLGYLLTIALFVALLADMTLLPALLLLFYKPKEKSLPETKD